MPGSSVTSEGKDLEKTKTKDQGSSVWSGEGQGEAGMLCRVAKGLRRGEPALSLQAAVSLKGRPCPGGAGEDSVQPCWFDPPGCL